MLLICPGDTISVEFECRIVRKHLDSVHFYKQVIVARSLVDACDESWAQAKYSMDGLCTCIHNRSIPYGSALCWCVTQKNALFCVPDCDGWRRWPTWGTITTDARTRTGSVYRIRQWILDYLGLFLVFVREIFFFFFGRNEVKDCGTRYWVYKQLQTKEPAYPTAGNS